MSQFFVLLSKAASQLLFYLLAKLSTQVQVYDCSPPFCVNKIQVFDCKQSNRDVKLQPLANLTFLAGLFTLYKVLLVMSSLINYDYSTFVYKMTNLFYASCSFNYREKSCQSRGHFLMGAKAPITRQFSCVYLIVCSNQGSTERFQTRQ